MACPCEGCKRPCDTTRYVMCDTCWELVPTDVGNLVYRTWGLRCRSGHNASSVERHEKAKQDAIDYVNEERRRREPQTRRAI